MSLTGRSDTELNASIEGGDYWPTLQLADFIHQFRLPVEHKAQILTNEINVASLVIQEQLALFRQAVPVFADLTTPVYSMAAVLTLYQRAVFALARARLGKHFLSLGSKASNDVQADLDDNSYDYWLGQSEQAVEQLIKAVGKKVLPAGFLVETI